jgi:hypothetical protein
MFIFFSFNTNLSDLLQEYYKNNQQVYVYKYFKIFIIYFKLKNLHPNKGYL